MSILQSVFRRIIIRNVDKAITGTAKKLVNSSGQSYSEQVKLPTVGNLIWNVLAFAIFIFGLSSILLSFGTELAYIIPILFIGRVIRPLFYNYTYDFKSVPVTKSDKRYTTGSKVVGYKSVKDKEAKINYDEGQIRISKIEGVIKLLLFLGCLLFIYNSTTTTKFKLENMSFENKVNLLTVGDTLFTNSAKIDFYAKFKDSYSNNVRIVRSGIDSVAVAGIFIKLDSATDSYGKKYEKFFEIAPITEPRYDDPILYQRKDRIGKTWYVDPSDINIGQYKFKSSKKE